ncbi:MAG TPA: lysylphosphatidylglycerol synthase transmembrane domain-containing protein [Bryobacteraceae bacterium]
MQRSILARTADGGTGNGAPPHAANSGGWGPRRWRWLALALVAGALALWGIEDRWAHGRFQWAVFGRTFAELSFEWVAISFTAALATYYVRALRWAVMLEPLKPKASVWGLFKATAIGFTAIVLLGRPGEFVRPYLISLRERVPLSSQFAAWFLERVCDLLAMLLLFGFALSQIRTSRASLGPAFRWVLETGGYAVAALVLVCLVILVMLGRYPALMRKRLVHALAILPNRYQQRIERSIGAFMDGTSAMTTRSSALRLSFYTLAEWALITICIVSLFNAHPATSSFRLLDALIFMGFVAFGSVLQIPGVGGGFQIVSVVVLTQLYGLPVEIATGLAVMLWIITFVGVIPLGILLAFHEGINWRKLRDLERRAISAGSTLGDPVP